MSIYIKSLIVKEKLIMDLKWRKKVLDGGERNNVNLF